MNYCIRGGLYGSGVAGLSIEGVVACHDVLESSVVGHLTYRALNIITGCVGAVYRADVQSTVAGGGHLDGTITVGSIVDAGRLILGGLDSVAVGEDGVILEVVLEEVDQAGDHSLSLDLVGAGDGEDLFLALACVGSSLYLVLTIGDDLGDLFPCGQSVIDGIENGLIGRYVDGVAEGVEEADVIRKTVLRRSKDGIFLNFRILVLHLLNAVGNTCSLEEVGVYLAEVEELIERRSLALALEHAVDRLHSGLDRLVDDVGHTVTVTGGLLTAVVGAQHGADCIIVDLEAALYVESGLGLVEVGGEAVVALVGDLDSTSALGHIILIERTETCLGLSVGVHDDVRVEEVLEAVVDLAGLYGARDSAADLVGGRIPSVGAGLDRSGSILTTCTIVEGEHTGLLLLGSHLVVVCTQSVIRRDEEAEAGAHGEQVVGEE